MADVIPVRWVNRNPRAAMLGYWDQHIAEWLTDGDQFDQQYLFAPEPGGTGAVVVISAGANREADNPERIAEYVASLPWAVTLLTADEGAAFPHHLLPRDDRHQIWGQYQPLPAFDALFPIGPPPFTDCRPCADPPFPALFIGQVTHARRRELIDALGSIDGSLTLATGAFSRGFDRDVYLRLIPLARVVPCPSGPVSLDSFRLYEALDARTIPVIETLTPQGYAGNFWTALLGDDHPIPTVPDWGDLPALVAEYADLDRWRAKAEEIGRWYDDWRHSLRVRLLTAVNEVR